MALELHHQLYLTSLVVGALNRDDDVSRCRILATFEQDNQISTVLRSQVQEATVAGGIGPGSLWRYHFPSMLNSQSAPAVLFQC